MSARPVMLSWLILAFCLAWAAPLAAEAADHSASTTGATRKIWSAHVQKALINHFQDQGRFEPRFFTACFDEGLGAREVVGLCCLAVERRGYASAWDLYLRYQERPDLQALAQAESVDWARLQLLARRAMIALGFLPRASTEMRRQQDAVRNPSRWRRRG